MQRARVLVVDDELLIRRAVRRILASAHDVFEAEDGVQALTQIAQGERFDLILLDLTMPRMGGAEVLRELELLAPEQASRVVFLTGWSSDALPRGAASPHLQKPFQMSELLALVDALISAGR